MERMAVADGGSHKFRGEVGVEGGSDFYEVTMRNGLNLCGGLLKRSQATQQSEVIEYQSARAEWKSESLTLTPNYNSS